MTERSKPSQPTRIGRRSVLGRSWRGVCEELVGHYRAAIASRASALAGIRD